jgi:YVTN family beta-propeller protein
VKYIIVLIVILSALAEIIIFYRSDIPKYLTKDKTPPFLMAIKKSSTIDHGILNSLLNVWTQNLLTSKITIVPNAYAENNISRIEQISSDRAVGQPGLAVDSYPIGVAVNPITKKVYVTNEFSNTVSVINGATDSVTDTIGVGSFPYGVTVNPFNDRVYVTNRGSNSVSVIDGPTNAKLANIIVGNSPVGIAVNPSTNWIYVTDINSGTMSVIDGITNKVTDTITVGKAPYGVAVNPITNKVYVTNIESNTVSVIDGRTNKVSANITVGKSPVGVSVNTLTNIIYITNHVPGTVSVIDGRTNKVSANITVGKSPVGVSVNPITNKVYVTNIESNTVSVIDGRTNSIISSLTVNPSLQRPYIIGDPVLNMPILVKFPFIASLVVVNSVSNLIYVTNTGSDTVSIIDGNKDRVMVKVAFNVNPPNVGDIECNGQQILSNSSIRYSDGTDIVCIANPAHGYKFSAWSGVVDSSRNPIIFKASQYGTLTANFKESLSLEQYLAIIFGAVSIISITVGWIFRNRQRRYLNKYLTTIHTAYDTLYKNGDKKQQEYLLRLDTVRKEVTNLYIKGRISDAHYNVLDRVISDYIGKVNK